MGKKYLMKKEWTIIAKEKKNNLIMSYYKFLTSIGLIALTISTVYSGNIYTHQGGN